VVALHGVEEKVEKGEEASVPESFYWWMIEVVGRRAHTSVTRRSGGVAAGAGLPCPGS
jgi:hypothetical protein